MTNSTPTDPAQSAYRAGHILRCSIKALDSDSPLDETDAFAISETLREADRHLAHVLQAMDDPEQAASGSKADLPTLENWEHTAGVIAQVSSLTQALQLVLKEEGDTPLRGNQPGALAIAIERAAQDAMALFEAYYHPSAGMTVNEIEAAHAANKAQGEVKS